MIDWESFALGLLTLFLLGVLALMVAGWWRNRRPRRPTRRPGEN
jgi:hypothetical protein